jgi:hypothetical protein
MIIIIKGKGKREIFQITGFSIHYVSLYTSISRTVNCSFNINNFFFLWWIKCQNVWRTKLHANCDMDTLN